MKPCSWGEHQPTVFFFFSGAYIARITASGLNFSGKPKVKGGLL
jgi:hypothetical protein